MKNLILSLVAVIAFTHPSLSQGGDLVGYSHIDENNNSNHTYEIITTAGTSIYTNKADEIKTASLRDGHGVVQTKFNQVSWIKEDGAVIAKNLFGSKFKFNANLLAVYNPGTTGVVVNADGKQIFKSSTIKDLTVANDYFGVIDAWSGYFKVYSSTGAEAWSQFNVKNALMSNAFVALYSDSDEFTLKTAQGDLIEIDYSIKNAAVSDQFAAFTGSDGWLRVYSAEDASQPILERASVKSYTLHNSYFTIEDSFGLELLNSKGETIYSTGAVKAYTTASKSVVIKLNTGSLLVVNDQGNTFQTNSVDEYTLSSNALATKTGAGLYQVYSLTSEKFGKPYSNSTRSMQDTTINTLQLGLTTVGILYDSQRSATVQLNDEIIVRKNFVDRLDLSQSGQSVNWSQF